MKGLNWRAAIAGAANAVILLGLGMAIEGAAEAQSRNSEQTIGAGVGERILETMEAEAEGDWAGAAAAYDALLQRASLSAYERATLQKLRGRARYELDDLPGAIADWRAAIASDALPPEDANALRVNTGQLLFAAGRFGEGVALVEAALARGTPLTEDLALRMAQAHGQAGTLSDGLDYARAAFDLAEPPDRPHFSILLYYFQQLDMLPEQTDLLEAMVNRWPEDKRNWTSYAALLAQTGRERDAFEVNRIMYVNGMLETSEELVRLAQYYSYYEYPFGGASMLERELNSGRVEPAPRNYQLLADLWRQAREWERAMPVLRRVATLTGAGTDYEKLGEALYQAGDFAEAEAVLVQALDRGGLRRPGDTWTLLGNAVIEQDRYEDAIPVFERALEWEYSRAGAQGWLDFIERSIAIRNGTVRMEHMTNIEGCEFEIERMRRSVALSDDEYDSGGRRVFDLSELCAVYFDPYGRLRPEFEQI